MTSKVEFPIRAKLLLVTGAMILAATAAYLALAVRIFHEDKTALVYELNSSGAKTLAAETDSYLSKITDKVRLLTQGHRDPEWVRAVLEAEPDLVAFTLYQPTTDVSRWTPVATIRKADYLKLYGLGPEVIDKLRERLPIPFAKVLARRSWAINATLPGGAPILSVAIALPIQPSPSAAAVDFVAVADLRLDRLLKLVSRSGIATLYIVDAEGNVVAHPELSWVSERRSLLDLPIVKSAIESPVALQTRQFDWDGRRWLGAHAAVGLGGLNVISQVEERQAFDAARSLIEKSLLFALLVVTASILITGRFSRSLTLPVEELVAATEKISRWEFGESLHVRTRDELARLARAFNSMAGDLQNQRGQLEAQSRELELKVKERTADLEAQKRQLAEAQDALLRTTRLASLGELAGAAAHEVLNPINNMNIRVQRLKDRIKGPAKTDASLFGEIVGAWDQTFRLDGWKGLERELKKPASTGARMLVDEDLENLKSIAGDNAKRLADQEEDMEFLIREIGRVTRIINNMRSLSRVGGERKPLDVHLALDDTAVTLADILAKREVTLVKDYGADTRERYSLVGDKDELVQVFSNLIRNGLQAINSAERRAGEVRITTVRSRERVEVRIADNGTGIRKEHLERLFEPNFTTKSVEEGTGLGLSISRRLVRAFGGDIEVESTVVGEGTTFLVWFPAAM